MNERDIEREIGLAYVRGAESALDFVKKLYSFQLAERLVEGMRQHHTEKFGDS